MNKRIDKKKFLLFIGLVIFCIFLFKNTEFLRNYSSEEIKNFINSYGKIAPIVYIILFASMPITIFPDALLVIAGGMAFGILYGTIYTMIGAILASTLAFVISRYFARDRAEKFMKEKFNFNFLKENRNEFLTILILRLIPLIPFDVISYGAGFSKIKYKNFISATILGIIPGVVVFTNLGDKSLNFKSIEFLCAIGLLIALLLISLLLKKKTKYLIESD